MDILGTLAAIFYIAFFILVIKGVAFILYKRKIKKLEPFKKVTDGITYYVLHTGTEVCVIGSEHKMIRSQLEKIVPLYQENSKVISFRDGVSVTSDEYAHCVDEKIVFSSSRKKSVEERQELATI